MRCRSYQHWLALYVEGDLPAHRVPRVEGHVAQCEECRDFLEAMRDSQAALHALGREDIDEDALGRVRTAVMAGVYETPPARAAIPLRWAMASAMAAMVVLAGFAAYQAVPGPSEEQVSQSASMPLVLDADRNVQMVQAPVPDAMVETRSEYPAVEPLMIKLVTDDPNIVIYWLVDGNEEYEDDSTA